MSTATGSPSPEPNPSPKKKATAKAKTAKPPAPPAPRSPAKKAPEIRTPVSYARARGEIPAMPMRKWHATNVKISHTHWIELHDEAHERRVHGAVGRLDLSDVLRDVLDEWLADCGDTPTITPSAPRERAKNWKKEVGVAASAMPVTQWHPTNVRITHDHWASLRHVAHERRVRGEHWRIDLSLVLRDVLDWWLGRRGHPALKKLSAAAG